MATNYKQLTSISDWAIAPDGGSLRIVFESSQGKASFTLVRSFASRGDGTFGKVKGEDGAFLSEVDVIALREHLETLCHQSGDAERFVATFISAITP
jgi:hypothetical protein